ncbi:hypothetical protein BRC93_03000 [Halobacteriales archaeon QS_5_70_15]|jgi:hypothetical protein|nr:MAG: hypothetical protein BRC93_03000 [Halobacteriales archaeon QS_5_70_15]
MVHPLVITALKTAALLFGGVITLFAYRAYARTRAPALRALAVGFGTVTLGAAAAGAVDFLPGFERQLALVLESALTALGFGVIAYSLYAEM